MSHDTEIWLPCQIILPWVPVTLQDGQFIISWTLFDLGFINNLTFRQWL
jgi:uncharacterized membrane protein YqaE (UPF0057 family)